MSKMLSIITYNMPKLSQLIQTRFFLSAHMKEEIFVCLSPPLPPSAPHSISFSVIFAADEAELNVYDR